MGFAEQRFFDYLRNNHNIMKSIEIKEMMNILGGVFTTSTAEQLQRDLDRSGNENTLTIFLSYLRKRDNAVNHFLRALWDCGQYELYYQLREVYRSHRPKTVWEPDHPPYSLPPPLSNDEHLLPDSPQNSVSLPVNQSSLQPQPDRPLAPSPSQAQPGQVSRWSHEPQESNDPPTLRRAPTSQSPPPAPAVAQPVSPPDEVDTGTSKHEIYNIPVPESSPVQAEPFMENDGATNAPEQYLSAVSSLPTRKVIVRTEQVQNREAPNPPEQSLPAASSLPAKKDHVRIQPLQEKSENREVAHPVEQRTSVVNTPRKDAVTELPLPSVHREVEGSDAPNPSGSPESSVHEVNNAWTAPRHRELPAYSQGTSTGQGFGTNSTRKRPPVEKVPDPVTDPPSQHLSTLSLESGANAGAGHQRREPSTHQPSVQNSSCRPTDDDRTWGLGLDKPGVLTSSAGCANASGETNEVPPLSSPPILEISDDESSNEDCESSGSSQPPAMKAGKENPTPQEAPTTSTPKTASSWSSLKKGPEENEEPRRVSSSNRPPNASVSQEPEENSFELSQDLSYYRLQYNEDPSVDLMADNNLLHHRTMNTSGATETSHREVSKEKEEPMESNLHNPLVITLSAAVVCLSLYIIWLKYKN